MVYHYVNCFIWWYINRDIGINNFTIIMWCFILRILKVLLRPMTVILIRWEEIRVLSIVLISFWMRRDAVRSANAAVLYNRIRDFFLLAILFTFDLKILWVARLIACMGKSAILIFRYWLPMAMERPTPVSSLLHSSTMVVAGVVISSWYVELSWVLPVTAIMIGSFFLINWYDAKKMIALSTGVHLGVIMLAVSIHMYRLCLIHVVCHRLVKASVFVVSGVYIHTCGSQDLRVWGMNNIVMIICLRFLLLCGIGRGLINSSKENIVILIIGLIIVMVGWNYTKSFFTNISGNVHGYIMINIMLVLIFGTGGIRFDLNGAIGVIHIIMISAILNLSLSYVINK